MRSVIAMVLLFVATNAYANGFFLATGRFPEDRLSVITFAGSSDSQVLPAAPSETFGLTKSDARQAKVLMEMYDLHPSNSVPSIFRMKLANNLPPFDSMISASRKIGYDLTKYIGTEIEEHRYRLKQKTESGEAIDAVFLVNGGNVVGAFLVLIDYLGGVSSLKDHSQFAE